MAGHQQAKAVSQYCRALQGIVGQPEKATAVYYKIVMYFFFWGGSVLLRPFPIPYAICHMYQYNGL